VPSPRKLTASTSPVTAVSVRSANGSGSFFASRASLASGPTTAAHLGQEAATQHEADAYRDDERDEGTVNPVGSE